MIITKLLDFTEKGFSGFENCIFQKIQLLGLPDCALCVLLARYICCRSERMLSYVE